MIKGTPLHTLVDCGATRLFIDEKLQLCPSLHFIGAYSSLKMANGKIVVPTGIAPDVLVSIGKIQFRLDLVVVPLMEGYDIVLGKDWLDIVNPLIDSRNNKMYIRQGDQLHIVLGDPNVQSCRIKDQGLNGPQDNSSLLHRSTTNDLQFGRWVIYLSSWHLQSFASTRPASINGHRVHRGWLSNPKGRYKLRI